MEKLAWRGTIKQGKKAEYIKRHDEIWPQLVAVLKQAGICNYTIFCSGDELFGYYECEKGLEFAQRVQAQSEVVAKWNEFMKDVLSIQMDPVTGAQLELQKVFSMQ